MLSCMFSLEESKKLTATEPDSADKVVIEVPILGYYEIVEKVHRCSSSHRDPISTTIERTNEGISALELQFHN